MEGPGLVSVRGAQGWWGLRAQGWWCTSDSIGSSLAVTAEERKAGGAVGGSAACSSSDASSHLVKLAHMPLTCGRYTSKGVGWSVGARAARLRPLIHK